jgi:hypothetical protein
MKEMRKAQGSRRKAQGEKSQSRKEKTVSFWKLVLNNQELFLG